MKLGKFNIMNSLQTPFLNVIAGCLYRHCCRYKYACSPNLPENTSFCGRILSVTFDHPDLNKPIDLWVNEPLECKHTYNWHISNYFQVSTQREEFKTSIHINSEPSVLTTSVLRRCSTYRICDVNRILTVIIIKDA